MLEYGWSPTLAGRDTRDIAFYRLYRSRKLVSNPSAATARRQLIQRLGRPAYCARWLLRKLTNPFFAIARSIRRKRKPAA